MKFIQVEEIWKCFMCGKIDNITFCSPDRIVSLPSPNHTEQLDVSDLSNTYKHVTKMATQPERFHVLYCGILNYTLDMWVVPKLVLLYHKVCQYLFI